jgi:NAD(P)-dependent dehydrogenase (short-subunit alcohol dehydrogenase family)
MKVVVVAGANVGLGGALAQEFQRDAHVVALGRAPAIAAVAAETAAVPVACELTDPDGVARALAEVERTLAPPDVVIYNAHRIELRSALETTPDAFVEAWRAGCLGAFVVARRVLPRMRDRRAGTLVFTGATGSVRGGKRSAAFASAKFALRGLAQSLAREFGPAGVHVVHVVIDGLVWSERSRAASERDTRPRWIRARSRRHIVTSSSRTRAPGPTSWICAHSRSSSDATPRGSSAGGGAALRRGGVDRLARAGRDAQAPRARR